MSSIDFAAAPKFAAQEEGFVAKIASLLPGSAVECVEMALVLASAAAMTVLLNALL